MPSDRGKVYQILQLTAIVSAFGTFVCVYGHSVGLGFISDDFGWIRNSQVHSVTDFWRLFTVSPGFYRPVVSLTFAADFALFGMHPLGYGLTNLALALMSALILFLIARHIGIAASSWLVPALWLLNFHGMNMALLWISGRTSLLVTDFALASVLAALRGSTTVSVIALLLALLCKEEAVLLPVVLIIWTMVLGKDAASHTRVHVVTLIAWSVCALLFYGFLRHYSGAVTPYTAPSYYRFTFAPSSVFRNAVEYFDRACTFSAVVSLVAWAVLRQWLPVLRRRTLILGLTWILSFYVLTVFLPVRSSLYACLPSVGAALIAAEFIGAIWVRADISRKRQALVLAILLPPLLSPIYIMRDRRWTDLARFSTSVLSGLSPDLSRVAPNSWVVLEDRDRDRRVNVQSAFGTLVGDALSLSANRPLHVWVEPPLTTAGLAGMRPPCTGCPVLRRTIAGGQVQR